MKRFIPVLIAFILILTGCGSSKKNLEKGNYDAAIDKAVRQLRRDPNDEKQAAILEKSYRIANEQDNERIRFLKMENKPSNWDEIYLISKRMSDRQALVRTVTPLTISGKTVDFPYVDYMPEMVAAKRKSADYYFVHGTELMKNGLKESYRQAFEEFVRAKEYVGDYEGVDNKIAEAKYLGTSRVLVSIRNRSVINFPAEFEQELLALDLPRLNSQWVEYHTQNLDPNLSYDYMVDINIRNVIVSPDQTLQRDTVVKKEVEDGFVYMLDKKGNVMKDSLGNDIKTPKYKTLQCALIQLNPNKVVKKDPLGARSDFEHVSARALGDIQALSSSQLERTKSKPVPFPSDAEMILRCSETLKQAIRSAVQSNRRFIN